MALPHRPVAPIKGHVPTHIPRESPHAPSPLDGDYSIHKLVLGTHTSAQEANYLMIAKVRLPLEDTLEDYLNEKEEKGRPMTCMPLTLLTLLDVSDKQKQLEIYENRVNIETKILHDGELNRARHMP